MTHTSTPWTDETIIQIPAGIQAARLSISFRAMSEENYQLAKACVNACAEFKDPATEISNLKARVAELEDERVKSIATIKFVASELSGDPSDGETDTGTWILETFSDVYHEVHPEYDSHPSTTQQ